jgi:uncharacterized protein
MSRRLVVVPRWAGTPRSDWYPWLVDDLEARSPRPFDPVVVADMPAPDSPTIRDWVPSVLATLGRDGAELHRTVVVGHSVGCQAVLRALAELPDGERVAGVLCVAGWLWTDDPWETLKPWIDTPFDEARSRLAAGDRIVVMLSDDDPHTTDWRASTSAWRARLGAAVVLVPGARHFNDERSPIVLQTLLDHFAPKEHQHG